MVTEPASLGSGWTIPGCSSGAQEVVSDTCLDPDPGQDLPSLSLNILIGDMGMMVIINAK